MMQKWFEILKESYEEYQVYNNGRAKELADEVWDDLKKTYATMSPLVWKDLTVAVEPDREKRWAWMRVI